MLSETNNLICYMPKTELQMQSYDAMNMAKNIRVSGRKVNRVGELDLDRIRLTFVPNPSSCAYVHHAISPYP